MAGQHISADKTSDSLSFASAVYMSAMILTTVGEGGDGPVPVSTLARIAATFVLIAFLPLVAIRVSCGECSRVLRCAALEAKRNESTRSGTEGVEGGFPPVFHGAGGGSSEEEAGGSLCWAKRIEIDVM